MRRDDSIPPLTIQGRLQMHTQSFTFAYLSCGKVASLHRSRIRFSIQELLDESQQHALETP